MILLVPAFAATRLRMELDRIPLWRGDHVEIRQLAEDFAPYLYLPRLAEPAVLMPAIRDGLGLLTWWQDSFAYADSYDEAADRYRGLRYGQLVTISEGNPIGLLVIWLHCCPNVNRTDSAGYAFRDGRGRRQRA